MKHEVAVCLGYFGMQGGANCLLSHPFPTRSPTWQKHVKLQIGSRGNIVGNCQLLLWQKKLVQSSTGVGAPAKIKRKDNPINKRDTN
jgi:hypothetical protein